MRAIVVDEFGGPEVLTLAEVPEPSPGPGQVLVRVAVSGVNFYDVYQRTGATSARLPLRPGFEGVGVVTALGSEVTDLRVGQRVGWLSGGPGSFADLVAVQAARAVPIPDDVPDDVACAVLVQGVAAHALACDAYAVSPGDDVLVQAAAGGVGQLLTQIATLRGGSVLATTSSAAKSEQALAAGAVHVLGYDGFAERVRELTGGAGVAAAYDGVGATTFDGSLASLRPRGVLVLYGAASGPVPPFDLSRLADAGSVYVTRPITAHYTATAAELRTRTDELFGWLAGGRLRAHIGGRFPLEQAAAAFTALESRRSTGKLLLTH